MLVSPSLRSYDQTSRLAQSGNSGAPCTLKPARQWGSLSLAVRGNELLANHREPDAGHSGVGRWVSISLLWLLQIPRRQMGVGFHRGQTSFFASLEEIWWPDLPREA